MRRTILLAAICVLVGGYLFFVELPSRRNETTRVARESRVLQLDPESVHTIRRRIASESLQLVFDGSEWRMVAPRQEPAQRDRVVDFLTQLMAVERYRRIDETGENALEYGLGQLSESRVILELEGEVNVSLEIGQLTPTEGGCYYRILGESAVDVAAAALYELAQMAPSEFRQTRLWDFADSTVVRVGVRGAQGAWEARRDERGLWHRSDDATRELRQWQVDDLVFQLTHTEIRAFEREDLPDSAFSAYGLWPPMCSLQWAEADGDSGSLHLGNDAEQPGLIFARRDRGDSVLLLAGQLLQFGEMAPEAWLDRNPIDENFKQIREIEVELEDGTRALGRGPRGFDLVTVLPPGSKLKPADLHIALRNVYYGIGRLDILSSRDLQPGEDARASVDRWVATMHLRWADHERLVRLGWNGSSETHWIQVDEEPRLHQVDRGLFFRLQGWVMGAQS